MVEHVIKVAVIYTCKVSISGYKLIDGDRSSKVVRTPRLLVPKDPLTLYKSVEFSERTLNEFQSIIGLKRNEEER